MDKKSVVTKVLMAIGFVAAGIGGAVTAGEIPENIERMKTLMSGKEEETPETEEDQ